jgi:pyruvate carboxylase
MLGDIVKVTPTSKVVGDMALLMVTAGLSRAAVLDPDTEISFPESMVQYFHGDIGQPYGGFPEALQRKVLKGVAPREQRPGAELPDADLESLRLEASTRAAHPVTDQQFASYLMYPKVFTDYAADRRRYSDVAILPTPVFFYGMRPGQEVSIDLERGKMLIVRYVTQGEPLEDGTRTVFFELNGQPRSVRVSDRSQKPKRPPQRKVDAGNLHHVGAPMPGTVASIAVSVGQRVARGDVVATLEAMKMEAAVRAEIDGEVAEVLVQPGMQVDPKDLMIVLA